MIPWLVGLSGPIVALMCIALALCIVQLAVAIVLTVAGHRATRIEPAPGDESQFLWVFLVPALNEEVTIADTVQRLIDLQVTHRVMMIIDDGSTDRTAQILHGISHPDLSVLSRTAPRAQQGKGAALNQAWEVLHERLRAEPRWATFPVERVLVTVVDADGRLDPAFAHPVAGHFADPSVGGVQLRVRIYNHWSLLARLQDVEFRVYGALYQMGRTFWGTAGMGGNGQINRLTALDDIAAYNGRAATVEPWRDRLTEDQDLGISLLATGWRSHQEMRASVHQQGLSSVRRLLRQRTRWAQGCIQACRRIRVPASAQIPIMGRLEGISWLLQPLIQFYIGLMLMLACSIVVTAHVPVIPTNVPWEVIPVLLLSLGGTGIGCVVSWSRTERRGLLLGVAWIVPYAVYTWLLVPVYLRAMVRELTGRSAWAKTARESITQP